MESHEPDDGGMWRAEVIQETIYRGTPILELLTRHTSPVAPIPSTRSQSDQVVSHEVVYDLARLHALRFDILPTLPPRLSLRPLLLLFQRFILVSLDLLGDVEVVERGLLRGRPGVERSGLEFGGLAHAAGLGIGSTIYARVLSLRSTVRGRESTGHVRYRGLTSFVGLDHAGRSFEILQSPACMNGTSGKTRLVPRTISDFDVTSGRARYS